MVEDRQLRCLIAAGGTVGHVAPSLAVAEALRERGVAVTFAGSRERVEARLVPEHGYPFDSFPIAGFPRRPGPRLVRALGLAAASPAACLRILARRRPDVVLGGGGYVAGPMVLAAWLRRIPAALTEADAHLGLANRLAVPFAQRLFLAYPIPGVDAKARVVGRPIPTTSRAVARREARQALGLPEEGPVLAVFGGSLGARTLNELALETWGAAGPAVLHLCGERHYEQLRGRVGGAGMSAYALLARAWGADVAGWDRVETPYLAHLEGVDVTISPEPPQPPGGSEVYVSTAFAGAVEGRPRADLLAQLVSLRRSIVVAGAHGKTTTSAMIAFCLDRLGLDPAFLIGGEVPQLGGNARAGEGWLVVEGDESDRSVAALRPQIAVLLNVDLDHHTTFGSRAEVAALLDEWLARAPQAVRAEELAPVELELRVTGEHNRRNA